MFAGRVVASTALSVFLESDLKDNTERYISESEFES